LKNLQGNLHKLPKKQHCTVTENHLELSLYSLTERYILLGKTKNSRKLLYSLQDNLYDLSVPLYGAVHTTVLTSAHLFRIVRDCVLPGNAYFMAACPLSVAQPAQVFLYVLTLYLDLSL
jgi:hypothetical protein